jgi:hypothetical protein
MTEFLFMPRMLHKLYIGEYIEAQEVHIDSAPKLNYFP